MQNVKYRIVLKGLNGIKKCVNVSVKERLGASKRAAVFVRIKLAQMEKL